MKTEKKSEIVDSLFYIYVLHLGIALLEIYTVFRLPTSPLSSYYSLFGGVPQEFSPGNHTEYVQMYPTTFFNNPNRVAFFNLLLFPLVLYLVKKNLAFFLIILSSFLVTFECGSRGLLAIQFFTLVLFNISQFDLLKMKISLRKILISAMALICSVLIFVNTSSEGKINEIKSTPSAIASFIIPSYNRNENHELKDSSNNNRHKFVSRADTTFFEDCSWGWDEGLIRQGCLKRWAVGLGVGYFSSKQLHNYWFELFYETGLLGLIFFLLLLIGKIFKNIKSINIYFFTSTFVIIVFGVLALPSVVYYIPVWVITPILYFKSFHWNELSITTKGEHK